MKEEPVPPAVLAAVMAGHFVAAFAALGLPPFFGLILEKSLHSDARFLAGWFYVVPTAFAALSSPWWGRVADRHGKKRLLIRAQLGLAASFLLAGFATSTWVFLAALALQGVLGGTFAASNAYLATVAGGPALARGMTAMQWSARAALVAAPLALGALLQVHAGSPIEIYRWLALLPLAAAVATLFLPAGGAAAPSPQKKEPQAAPELSARQVYALQGTFVFATVVTFPYFAGDVQARFGDLSTAAAGLLFGLPHAVYLVAAWPLTRCSARGRRSAWLAVAFLLLLASLIAQAVTDSLIVLAASRLLMGLGMTLGFIALHGLIAATVQPGNAGRSFGWFESAAKWGAVAAGLSAGLVAQVFGLAAPFVVGAAALAIASLGLMVLARTAPPVHPSQHQGELPCTHPTPGTPN